MHIDHITTIMITDDRKITGDKFVITLPQSWREGHNLAPGNFVTTMFKEGGKCPMVIIPKDIKLDEFQKGLIVALLDGPTSAEAKAFSVRLIKLAKLYEQISVAA